MKKRVLSVILALILLSVPLSITAHAAVLTPGVALFNLDVSTTVDKPFAFTKELFMYRFSGNPTVPMSDIEIMAFSGQYGTLKLGTETLLAFPRKIPISALDTLTFTPIAAGVEQTQTFEYRAYFGNDIAYVAYAAGVGTNAVCSIDITKTKPIANSLEFTVNRNETRNFSFVASDPRVPARPLTYEIVVGGTITTTLIPANPLAVPPILPYTYSIPHGTVRIINPINPVFEFKPDTDYLGVVQFEYKVIADQGVAATEAESTDTMVTIYVGGRPTAHSQNITVEKNTTYRGQLTATDPHGRSIKYVIETDPMNGTPDPYAAVTKITPFNGAFSYTPKRDFEGTDSFTFHALVMSSDGVTPVESETATVNITVAKYAITPVRYDDMLDHWAAISAGSLHALNIVKGDNIYFSTTGTFEGATENKRFFRPEEQITRGEFIMWLISALRIKPDASPVTVFSDTVPYWQIPATNAAYHANIALGTLVNGRRLLRADATLTRLEAIVMIDRAMKLSTSNEIPNFKDWATVPAWGQQEVMNLAGYGIVKGTPTGYLFPNDLLKRCDAAELLFESYKQAILEKR